MLFEDETSLSERQLTVLNEFEHPLSQLYTDWLSRDTDEMDAFRDSIACCVDDILRKRIEEKYRDPAQPIYPNTRSEAVVRGEVFEWMASRDRTLTCAGAFEKDATNAYNDGKLPAFLKEWTAAYGKDRCMFVLACTMAQRTGDERFYPPARHHRRTWRKGQRSGFLNLHNVFPGQNRGNVILVAENLHIQRINKLYIAFISRIDRFFGYFQAFNAFRFKPRLHGNDFFQPGCIYVQIGLNIINPYHFSAFCRLIG